MGSIRLGQQLAELHCPIGQYTALARITPHPKDVIKSAKFTTIHEMAENFPPVGMNSCFLIAARHGQTEWTVLNKAMGGETDIPLNEVGEAQSRDLAQKLSGLPISAIYTSPLSRAKFLGERLSKACKARLTPLPSLKELCYGELVGKNWQEFMGTKAPHRFRAPGGESLWDLKKRVDKTMRDITANHTGQTVGITAHGWVNKIIFMWAFGIHLSQFWQVPLSSPTGVTAIKVDPHTSRNELWLFNAST